MRMEFATLEELEEIGAKFLYYTDTSVIGEILKEEISINIPTSSKQDKICKIFASINTGKLYLAKNGKTTFSLTEAKEFVVNNAKVKISYMNKKGKYKWQME